MVQAIHIKHLLLAWLIYISHAPRSLFANQIFWLFRARSLRKCCTIRRSHALQMQKCHRSRHPLGASIQKFYLSCYCNQNSAWCSTLGGSEIKKIWFVRSDVGPYFRMVQHFRGEQARKSLKNRLHEKRR